MTKHHHSFLHKLKLNLPWLVRYPFTRANSFLNGESDAPQHIIFTIANHFEPSWSENGLLDLDTQRRRLDRWHKLARETGESVVDADGTKFRHTNFFPAEQYDFQMLEQLSEMQSDGLGEVEIHLHHGVEKPDTAANLRRTLIEFRDVLAEEHACLSRFDGAGKPMYAFVHGNFALANSGGGRFCGVDNEMQILQETGCYADMTLPSAPDISQVPMLNQIYECALPLHEKMPHRRGKQVAAFGNQPQLPLIFTGPLVFDWESFPVPRIDAGALAENQILDAARLNRWRSANITVKNRPEWMFIKLFCHGFFDFDQSACIGEKARRFFGEVVKTSERTGEHKVHFASAREAFNMVLAAIDGKQGTPHEFRNYRLQSIMKKCADQKVNSQTGELRQ